MDRPHLLLVNLGTPEAPTPESVRRFLDEFLSDARWLATPRLHRAHRRAPACCGQRSLHGERFIRVAAVDTHPAFIRSLAALAVA